MLFISLLFPVMFYNAPEIECTREFILRVCSEHHPFSKLRYVSLLAIHRGTNKILFPDLGGAWKFQTWLVFIISILLKHIISLSSHQIYPTVS